MGLAEGKNITIDNYNDLFLVREQTVERFFSDNTSVNRFVVSQAIFRCLYHLYDNWANETKLYSITTDGFFITNPRKQCNIQARKLSNFNPGILANYLLQILSPHILRSIIARIWTRKITRV